MPDPGKLTFSSAASLMTARSDFVSSLESRFAFGSSCPRSSIRWRCLHKSGFEDILETTKAVLETAKAAFARILIRFW